MNAGRKIAAVAVAITLVALLAGAKLGGGPDEDEVTVVAVFTDASPLVPGNVVKASGVDVGTIKEIDLEDGKARVEMRLDRAVLPLHQDVTATITTQDLLGERFVNLDRGTAETPVLDEPMVIDEKHTKRVVDLQDVLNAVDTPTSAALAALLTETGEGLKGHGADADKALAALTPAMRQARDLAAILSDHNELLGRLVDNAHPVAAALAADKGKRLDHLVASTTDTLGALGSEREALKASLQQLPQTMASARAALARLAGVADPATRTLRSLRPVTNDLDDISGELRRFADAADPALASLEPVLEKANTLLEQAGPVVAALRPAAHDLVPTTAAAKQLSLGAVSGKHLTNLMEFVKGWSMATSDYDAISHYFKAMVPLSPNALGDTAAGLLPFLPDDILHGLPVPTAPEVPLPGREKQPAATPQTGLQSLLEPLVGASQKDRDSATGLSEPQENALLEQLLGGLL